jgi:Protein of unknown function (DUF3568)
MTHRKQAAVAFILLACCFFLYGCPALVVGGAAVAGGTGTYYYVEGELKRDYYYPYDKVWSACEKTIADMRGHDVKPQKDAGMGQGKISAMIEEEKVQISVKYKGKDATGKDITTVSVRTGLMGNELSSKLLHDKLAENLTMN